MTKKQSLGLAGFGVKADTTASVSNDEMSTRSNDAKKSKSEIVACTVRLPRAAWLKIQHLALDEGTSFQALAVAGLDAELKRRGLPGIN